MKIITGYTGTPHVTAADDAAAHRSIFGAADCVFNVGEALNAEIYAANTIRVYDGIFSIQGFLGRVVDGTYDDVTITSGTPGTYRHDILTARYTRTEAGVEAMEFYVVVGTNAASEGAAADPAITQEDITGSGDTRDLALYRILYNGASASSIVKLFTPVSLVKAVTPSAANNVPTLSALGFLQDSGVLFSALAQKKVPAAAGNIATLDAGGGLGDSGKKVSDFPAITTDGSTYLIAKFPSGLMVQAKKFTLSSVDITNADGASLYSSSTQILGSYDVAFTQLYYANVSSQAGTSAGTWWCVPYLIGSPLTAWPSAKLKSALSLSALPTVTLCGLAVGRWD